MQAVIYVGEGVDIFLMKQMIAQMVVCPRKVGSHFFLSGDWEREVDLVIIPGGRDLPYHRDLQGEANQRLRAFVERGGRYLGICAGGYYGSKEVLFEEGGPLEVKGERELAFFPGRAVGPAFGKGRFAYGRDDGACTVKLDWEKGPSFVHFNGGCYFEEASKYGEVIASYADLGEAAIIACQVGRGRAFLSGVHPESPLDNDSSRQKLWEYLWECITV